MAFGLTEPDAGSNSHNVKTTARRTETGWSISGSKYYISAVDQSDAILLVTRDADHSTPQTKVALSLFVVPTDSPGLSLPADRHLDRVAGQTVHGVLRRRRSRR